MHDWFHHHIFCTRVAPTTRGSIHQRIPSKALLGTRTHSTGLCHLFHRTRSCCSQLPAAAGCSATPDRGTTSRHICIAALSATMGLGFMAARNFRSGTRTVDREYNTIKRTHRNASSPTSGEVTPRRQGHPGGRASGALWTGNALRGFRVFELIRFAAHSNGRREEQGIV